MFNLTIGIPTCNRAAQLAGLLDLIAHEFVPEDVEILVSDNGSYDSTQNVVEAFRGLWGKRLVYLRNDNDIGYDGNVLNVYNKARGRYVWFHSDDDAFVQGALSKILRVIRNEEPCGLIALPGRGCAPYQKEAERSFVALLPWNDSSLQVEVVLDQRRVLSGNAYERMALLVATSQISQGIVRRGLPIAEGTFGGGVMQSLIANLNLLSCPAYYILNDPISLQGEWNCASRAFMDSTLFGVRELYTRPEMRFTAEEADFVTVLTCQYGLGLLLRHLKGELPADVSFPSIGRGLADKLMRLYGAAYPALAPMVEELIAMSEAKG